MPVGCPTNGEQLNLSNFTQTMSGLIANNPEYKKNLIDLLPSQGILTNQQAGQLLEYPESTGNLGDFNNTVSQYFVNNLQAKENLEQSLSQQISSLQSGRSNTTELNSSDNFLKSIIQSRKENKSESFAEEENKKNEQIIQNILEKFMKTELVSQLNLEGATAFKLALSCAGAFSKVSNMSIDISNPTILNIVIDTTTDYLRKCSDKDVDQNLKEKVKEELGKITKEELEINRQNQK